MLTLYKELRAKAANSPISELLPSLLMLGNELGDSELSRWAQLELGGYVSDNPALQESDVVPEYRTVSGQWLNDYGQVFLLDDQELTPMVNGFRLRNGVAELEQVARSNSPQLIRDLSFPALIREHLQVEVTQFRFLPREVSGVLSNIRMNIIQRISAVRERVHEMAVRAISEADTSVAVEHSTSMRYGADKMRRIGAMIGSPSDATDERQAITEAILRWNAINRAKSIFIEPVKWESHATPGLEGRPQGMINEELVPISDILVAAFRSRAGSPTGKEVSGTIEEIREFMRLGKYVVLYFYEGEVSIGNVDPDQLKTINEFRKEIQQHGLTASYKNINELREHIICHLTRIVDKLAWSNDLDKAEAKDIQELLSTLASELISVIILCDELEQRQINPWLDLLRSQFGSTADSLRHMAASDTAIRQSMTTELEELATVLDEAANLPMHSGSWPQFQGLVKAVYDKATAIKQNRIDNVPLSEESLTEIKCTVNTTQRKLAGLAARAQDMMNQGRLDDLQGEPSQYGYTLLRVSYYNIDVIQPSLSEKVREVGRDLHLIETMRVYCDGGRSVRAIVERIKKNSNELTSLVEVMNQNEAKRT